VGSTHAVVGDALAALEAVAILAGGTGGGGIHVLVVALADTIREALTPAAAELVVGANAVAADARDFAVELHACFVGETGSTLIARILDALLRGRVLVVAIIAVLADIAMVTFRTGTFALL